MLADCAKQPQDPVLWPWRQRWNQQSMASAFLFGYTQGYITLWNTPLAILSTYRFSQTNFWKSRQFHLGKIPILWWYYQGSSCYGRFCLELLAAHQLEVSGRPKRIQRSPTMQRSCQIKLNQYTSNCCTKEYDKFIYLKHDLWASVCWTWKTEEQRATTDRVGVATRRL